MAGKAGGALENVLRAINPLGKRIKAKIWSKGLFEACKDYFWKSE